MRKTVRVAVLISITIVAGVISYTSLNWDYYPTPGWTQSIQILDKGNKPELTYYDNQFWVSYYSQGERGRKISIIHSLDGITWSSPIVLVEEFPHICPFPQNLKLLKRPDGNLWFFWVGDLWDNSCELERLYYTILKDDHTWSESQEVYAISEVYYFNELISTPEGGLTVLEDHDTECVVQFFDETLKKNPSVTIDLPYDFSISDIYCDQNSTYWLVLSSKENRAHVMTSDDGISWSEPRKIPINYFIWGHLLQLKNGQYLLIYKNGSSSMAMSFSPDGVSWSSPTWVARFKGEGKWLRNFIMYFDIVELDDGTLWVIIGNAEGLSITTFSEEQFEKDISVIQDFTLKTRIISICITLIAGVSCFIFYKKYWYLEEY